MTDTPMPPSSEATSPTGVAATAAPPASASAPASPHAFAELQAGAAAGTEAPLSVLYDLSMPISVELGRASMSVRELLTLARGAVVQLDRLAGEPVDIYVGERKLAEGEVVVLGDHFGVRLTRVIAGAATGAGAA